MRLLIVEDEPTLGSLLRRNLTARGFAVDLAAGKAEATEFLDLETYDVVLLDRGLGDGDGLALVPHIRAKDADTAILFLTARDAPSDRIAGLDAGADDYIVKPFDMDELVARLRAVLRRPGKRMSTVLEAGNLKFDVSQRRALVDGQPLDLPRQEANLLELLMRREGVVVRRDEIQRSLYGFDDEVTPNAVDAAISRLRKRLRTANAAVEIAVLRGVGCMLEARAA
ncbi:MAG TPA: response regulator transcription factor [Dongiaceae bacterium]|nr:response regulator transcription factor [Dongiaceae bacterium]